MPFMTIPLNEAAAPPGTLAIIRGELARFAPTLVLPADSNVLTVNCNVTEFASKVSGPMSGPIGMMCGVPLASNKLPLLIEAFGTDEYKRNYFDRTLLEESRDAFRGAAYAPPPPGLAGHAIPDNGGDAVEDLTENFPGVCLGRAHTEPNSLAALGAALDQDNPAKLLFLEEFQEELQADIHAYLNQGDDVPDVIPAPLQARIDFLQANMGVDWAPIFRKAKEKGVKVFGIDSEAAREAEGFGGEAFSEPRIAMMNAVTKRVMDAAMAQYPDEKFVAVVGAAHAHTHRGGIHGVAQMYGVPALKFEDDGTFGLIDEDTDLRGIPTKAEQGYIDRVIARKDLEDAVGEEGEAVREQVLADARRMDEMGALPTYEESLLLERYVGHAVEIKEGDFTAGNLNLDMVELAGRQALLDEKAALLVRANELLEAIADPLGEYEGEDLDALTGKRDQAQNLITQGSVKDLLRAVGELTFVDETLKGNAPDPVTQPSLRGSAVGDNIATLAVGALNTAVDDATQLWDQLNTAITTGNAVALGDLLETAPYLSTGPFPGGKNLLHVVAESENAALITLVATEFPALVNSSDADGNAPIHLACTKRWTPDEPTDATDDQQANIDRQTAAVAALVAAGANVDRAGKGGMTAMHLTALNYNTALLQDLFDAGADKTATDDRGWTALETSMAATSGSIEACFYAQDDVNPEPLIPADETRTTIEILMAATLCEDPGDQARVQEAYEQAYADETLRPMLDMLALDAARPRTADSTGGNRIFIAHGDKGHAFIKTMEGEPGPTYNGAYDKTYGVVHVSTGDGVPSPKDFAGVLMHELTHRAMHVAYEHDLLPFGDDEDDSKAAYREAIIADVQRMNLTTVARGQKVDSVEGRIRERITDRMQSYTNQPGEGGGDEVLMEEFIVSIPQLIAEFGRDTVEGLCPNLCAQFDRVVEKIGEVTAEDDRFNDFRDSVDNTDVDVELRDFPDPEAWLSPGGEAMDLDALMAKIGTQALFTDPMTPNPQFMRAEAFVEGEFRLEPITIPFTPEAYLPADPAEHARKMAIVRAALEKTMARDHLTLEISPDAFRILIEETGRIARETPRNDLKAQITLYTDKWVLQAKEQYLYERREQMEADPDLRLSPIELAESIILGAEREAAGEEHEGDYDVNRDKHASIVKNLKQYVIDHPEVRNSAAAQEEFLETSIARMNERRRKRVGRAHEAMRVKDGRGHRDDHVSINKDEAQKAWIAAARTMAAAPPPAV
ncbi:MAG: hypothetical protein AAF557_13595 [Pseudomonadota bacterium]